MILLAYLALFGIPAWAYAHVAARGGSPRAVATALVFGWLAMPLLRIDLPLVPQADKAMLLCGALLAALLQTPRVARLRDGLRWFDLPLLAFCCSPFCSSVANDLGVKDGLSSALAHSIAFGLPYALGRIAFRDAAALAELARALLLGAACYAPLCVFESRMAPQLHQWVFGMPGRVGWETVDFYGPLRYKASVFMESPLELTPLLGLGTVGGWCLWRALQMRRIHGYAMRWWIAGAAVAPLMGKSLGGVTLSLAAFATVAATRRLRTSVILVALVCVTPAYIATRASGWWDAMNFVEFLRENVSESRSASMWTRVVNENILVVKALEQPVFGWGGWGRNRVYDEEGKDISILDGFWIITLGCNGWFGLGSWLLVVWLPVALVLSRWRRLRLWRGSGMMVVWATTAVLIHSIDCIANSMVNPVYYLLMGALATIAVRGAAAVAVEAAAGSAAGGPPARRAPLRPRHTVSAS
ncbi:MAG: hypothetical protein ACK5AL_05195 [Planctomycetota bacterium]